MTEKIDTEEAEKIEIANQKLRDGLDIQITEVLERRKSPEDDVPPEVVLEAFRQDFPPPPIVEPDDPETFIEPLEGHNLKFTDATHIAGDGTQYNIDHKIRCDILKKIRDIFSKIKLGELLVERKNDRPFITLVNNLPQSLPLFQDDLDWIVKHEPKILEIKEVWLDDPMSKYPDDIILYYSDPTSWPPLKDADKASKYDSDTCHWQYHKQLEIES